MASVEITDNSAEVLAALEKAKAQVLEIWGGKIESYAKANVVSPKRLAPELRNSITHRVEGDAVRVGSNREDAPYFELGTGRHYEPPPEWLQNAAKGGRGQAGIESWIYYDPLEKAFKIGTPQEARPFLRPAVTDHTDEFKSIAEEQLKNADE